jgi:HEAT repeat protein
VGRSPPEKMTITPSASRQIESLISELSSGSDTRREAAVARLSVAGVRAVGALVRFVRSEPASDVKLAALRALDAIGDPRALDVAFETLEDPDARVVSASVALLRPFLRGRTGAVLVDRLTAVALDGSRHASVRTAAIEVLNDLDPTTLRPLWRTLQEDGDPAVRALVAAPDSDLPVPVGAVEDPSAVLTGFAERELPHDPGVLRDAIARGGEHVSVSTLHRLLDRIRSRERTNLQQRAEWESARGSVHMALARRDSRLGLYDLRESLEAATHPLPVEFLAAAALVGDPSCLESIALAYAQANSSSPASGGTPALTTQDARPDKPRQDWWERHLAETFQKIVAREGLTRRHAVMKRIARRWPEIVGGSK